MTTLDELREIGLSPVTERTERFQRVYEVCALFQIDCFAEAAHLLDRLDSVKWAIDHGHIGEESRN